jgi:hypothetical protein
LEDIGKKINPAESNLRNFKKKDEERMDKEDEIINSLKKIVSD